MASTGPVRCTSANVPGALEGVILPVIEKVGAGVGVGVGFGLATLCQLGDASKRSLSMHLRLVPSRFTVQILLNCSSTTDRPSPDQAGASALKLKSFLRLEPSAFIR